MIRKFALPVLLTTVLAATQLRAAVPNENDIRAFIACWNAAYTGLDAASLAALETPDYEMLDRFGHWIKSEGPEFNRRLWEMAFKKIYRGKPGPARQIESIRVLGPDVAIVQARAKHPEGVHSRRRNENTSVLGNQHLYVSQERRRMAGRIAQYPQPDQP